MRVITGSARGAKLKTLEGLATRPTSDRVKEAIFNIIQFDIEGRRVLDLFGGSGQLAIEALSRGADYAVLVDQSAEAVKVIKDNLNPTDEVKTDAAELAAYYSKARLSNLVQVDMIDVKKLNKPTAGKPGFVTYTGQKTLRVTPTEEKIDSMRMK